MSEIKTITQYKTRDGKLFTNIEDATYHNDVLEIEQLQKTDEFNANVHKIVNLILFRVYSQIEFEVPFVDEETSTKVPSIPIQIQKVEKLIGHDVTTGFGKLNAFGNFINQQLRITGTGVSIIATRGSMEEFDGIIIKIKDSVSADDLKQTLKKYIRAEI